MEMKRAEWLMNASLAMAYERAGESEEWRLLYERLKELVILVTRLRGDVKLLIGGQASIIDSSLADIASQVYGAVKDGDMGVAASRVSESIDKLRMLYSGIHVASFISKASRIVVSFALILTSLISMNFIGDLGLALILFLIIGLSVDSILLYKTRYPPYMLAVAGILGVIVSVYYMQMGQVMPGLLLASGLGASSMLIDWSVSSSFLKVSEAWISTTRRYH